LDREPSGYHKIETLFALLDLHDVLTVERRDDGISVDVDGADTGPEHQNLAYRAAKKMLDAADRRFGVNIHIEKSIPVQAGLGGGSSDGAAALHAVNMLLGDCISQAQILQIAAELGSDVPFFASRTAYAIGRGRGEQLISVPGPERAPALVVKPRFGVSTREAYELLAQSRRDTEPAQSPTLPDAGIADWPAIMKVTGNDFEDVLFARVPALRNLHVMLQETAPLITRLCGSGSAMIAVYATDSDRDGAMVGFTAVDHVIPTAIRAEPAEEPEFDLPM
jgi:4-diphosphocytidyl-2-C-methyl-D-erythritol kinase